MALFGGAPYNYREPYFLKTHSRNHYVLAAVLFLAAALAAKKGPAFPLTPAEARILADLGQNADTLKAMLATSRKEGEA